MSVGFFKCRECKSDKNNMVSQKVSCLIHVHADSNVYLDLP
jgi:hypothetical protein